MQASRSNQADFFAKHYNSSPLSATNAAQLKVLATTDACVGEIKEQRACCGVGKGRTNPCWWTVWAILKHRMRADYRQPKFVIPRVFDKCILAIVIFTLYW